MTTTIVGIGELAVAAGADEKLRTIALGSCVAIIVIDPARAVIGLAHAVLPAKDLEAVARKPAGYYVDLAVPALLRALALHGSGPRTSRLFVAIVGGGRASSAASSTFNIGARNIVAARTALQAVSLHARIEEVGGNWSRTVLVEPDRFVITAPDRAPLVYSNHVGASP